jgi:transcriptional regulator NrdR family protein
MKCPRCEHKKTYVLKSTRPQTKAVDVCKQRRRTCASCKRPFMTFEVHEADFDRLCALIKLEGPTRSPLRTRTDKSDTKPPTSDS